MSVERDQYAVLIIDGIPIVFNRPSIMKEEYVVSNTVEQRSIMGKIPIVIPNFRTLTLKIQLPTDDGSRAYYRTCKELIRLVQFLLAERHPDQQKANTPTNNTSSTNNNNNGDDNAPKRVPGTYAEWTPTVERAMRMGHERLRAANIDLDMLRSAFPREIIEDATTTFAVAGSTSNDKEKNPPQYSLCSYFGLSTSLGFCMIKQFKCAALPTSTNQEEWEIVLEEFNMGQFTQNLIEYFQNKEVEPPPAGDTKGT